MVERHLIQKFKEIRTSGLSLAAIEVLAA